MTGQRRVSGTFKERRRIATDPRPPGLAASPDGSTIDIGSGPRRILATVAVDGAGD